MFIYVLFVPEEQARSGNLPKTSVLSEIESTGRKVLLPVLK
jgi:hypothetical protein